MPSKRKVLDLLSRGEIVELVDRHELIVWDRRSKAQLAETLDDRRPALPEPPR